METRFGFKDFILLLFLAALIVLVLLGRKQYDRQWATTQQILERINEQTGDLARIRRLLEQGAVVTGHPTTGPVAPVDERVRKMQANPDYAIGDSIVDTFSV